VGLDFFFPYPESLLQKEVGGHGFVFEGAEKRQLGADRLALRQLLLF
jgi:hypothetical protein